MDKLTPETVKAQWGEVSDFSKASFPESAQELMEIVSGNLNGGKTADSGLNADAIFGMMHTYLAQGNGKEIIPKVQAIFAFEITKTKGGKVEAAYEIDLKNGQGNVKKGKAEKADATFTMTEADFE